jgi:acetyl-CoA C-acetyltransferase
VSQYYPKTPVLVGVSQYTNREEDIHKALTPLDMLRRVVGQAASDALGRADWLPEVDTVAVVRTFADSAKVFRPEFWNYQNLPRALAQDIGALGARSFYGPVGGNSPQWMINRFMGEIARGEANIVLIAGVEAGRTQAKAQRQGVGLNWRDHVDEPVVLIGEDKPGFSRLEALHGLATPASVYPLFENALGHHYGHDPVAHRHCLTRLFTRFVEVARENPYAAMAASLPVDLAEPSEDNRYIAYPYTKYLNANMFVDQAAAVLLMSAEKADALGVPISKRIYLHGCADINDRWLVSERLNYFTSPAIRIGAKAAFARAGIGVADCSYFDLYSCFPSAVEIAADEIGIAHEDPRRLTVTGGLPYFGGPGNDYCLHAVATMCERLRAMPGAFGLVSGNGHYLTKHSFGIYSSQRPVNPWEEPDCLDVESALRSVPFQAFADNPEGEAVVETFTVVFDRGAAARGIFVARMKETDKRCLAIATDPAAMASMIDQPVIGRTIRIATGERTNAATLA